MKLKLPNAQYYKKEWALDNNAISFIFIRCTDIFGDSC